MATQFEKLHEEALVPDQPHDAHNLQRINGRNKWLIENRGNSVCVTARSSQNSYTSGYHERPLVSISGYSSILQIPWWVEPTLSGFQVDAFVRISTARIDQGLDTFDAAGVRLRAHLLGNTKAENFRYYATVDAKGDAVWQWIRLNYSLGGWMGDRHDGYFDTLSIQFRSEIDNNMVFSEAVYSLDAVETSQQFRPDLVRANTAALYDDDSTGSAPGPGHWTTAAGVAWNQPGDSSRYMVTTYDHAAKPHWDGTDRKMYVWPPKPVLGRSPNEGGPDGIGLLSCGYLQVRSFQITEVHDAG